MQENHMQKCQNKGSKPSKKRKREDTVGWTNGPSNTSVGAIVGQVGAQGQILGTVRWTDGPLFSSIERVAEEEQGRQ
jgi:hypothetical protein